MVTLPIDLIKDFINRPKPIGQTEYLEKKKIVGEQAQVLNDVGKDLASAAKYARGGGTGMFDKGYRKLGNKEATFRRDVIVLESYFRDLEDSYKHQGGNFLLQVFYFVMGVLATVISILWFLHLILFTYPIVLSEYIAFSIAGNNYISPFLNDMIVAVSKIPIIGIVFYGMFAFHLLFCVIKGVTKVGMKLLVITLHPMAVGETMMNSLVFNTGVILISSLAVEQFLTLSLKIYAQNSASSSLFGLSFTYIKGLNYAFTGVALNLGFVALVTMIYQASTAFMKPKIKLSFEKK
jgi:LMBR1 domain-containing protein 1